MLGFETKMGNKGKHQGIELTEKIHAVQLCDLYASLFGRANLLTENLW